MQSPRLPLCVVVPLADLAAGVAVTAIVPWLRDAFVEGLLAFPDSADSAEAAGLELRIVDETAEQVIYQGSPYVATTAAPALALQGPGFTVLPVQRPVAAGDEWRVTLTNVGGGPVSPNLVLYLGDPYERSA